jgi:hypothetical protein
MENNKATETGSISAVGLMTGQTMNGNEGANTDPSAIPNPKLGMAPLSSELAVAAASNNVPAEGHQPSSRPPPDLLRPADPQSRPTSMPPPTDPFRSEPAATELPQVATIPSSPSEPELASQANHPPPTLPDTTTPPPDPAPTTDLVERSHSPHPNPTPPDPPPADQPIGADSHPPDVDCNAKEKS